MSAVPAGTRRRALALACASLLLAGGGLAAPQLKMQAETIADGELRARVLAGSAGVPPPTPVSRRYVVTDAEGSREVKWYAAADWWRLRALAGEWKDRKGNRLRIARVKSLPPAVESAGIPGVASREEIERALDAAEREFGGGEDELARWRQAWSGNSAVFDWVELEGRRYYFEFEFVEPVTDAAARKLLRQVRRSVAVGGASGGAIAAMRWWTREAGGYRFLTDLDRARGGKFVDDTLKSMAAMRKAYEFYVPPRGEMAQCTVRVFKTMSGYRDYRASTGEDEEYSCGLWDPGREELLICAQDRELAPRIMRHEAFHQYLFYATGTGGHAPWFDEGHACFFETVRFDPARNAVRVLENDGRARCVSDRLAECAAAILPLTALSHEEFYRGDLQLHYCTAWATAYFLEKGAWTAEEFAPYRRIVPDYLAAIASGADATTATRRAWAAVSGRDVASDFAGFWRRRRKRAMAVRQPPGG